MSEKQNLSEIFGSLSHSIKLLRAENEQLELIANRVPNLENEIKEHEREISFLRDKTAIARQNTELKKSIRSLETLVEKQRNEIYILTRDIGTIGALQTEIESLKRELSLARAQAGALEAKLDQDERAILLDLFDRWTNDISERLGIPQDPARPKHQHLRSISDSIRKMLSR